MINYDYTIVRYSEIGTKSRSVRRSMTDMLVRNIKPLTKSSISKFQSRIVVHSGKVNGLRFIPGVASYSPCFKTSEKEYITPVEKIISYHNPETFRVTVQRIDKSFPKTSMQVSKEVGDKIIKNFNLKVNLTKPELNLQIEIINGSFYVFHERIQGIKGYPVGSAGEATCLLDDEDSLIASLLIIKRGVKPHFVYAKKEFVKMFDKFLPGIKIKSEKLKDLKYLRGKTIIVGWGLDKLKKIKELKENGCLVLTPLVGLPDDVYEQYRKLFEQ